MPPLPLCQVEWLADLDCKLPLIESDTDEEYPDLEVASCFSLCRLQTWAGSWSSHRAGRYQSCWQNHQFGALTEQYQNGIFLQNSFSGCHQRSGQRVTFNLGNNVCLWGNGTPVLLLPTSPCGVLKWPLLYISPDSSSCSLITMLKQHLVVSCFGSSFYLCLPKANLRCWGHPEVCVAEFLRLFAPGFTANVGDSFVDITWH